MNGIPDECPRCDAVGPPPAFVDYDPQPNEAQKETEWADGLPYLKAIVCTDCGYLLGVFDPQNLADEEPTPADEYRIEGELE